MYMSRLVEVSKAENGYVIECHVPIKPDKKSEGKGMVSEYPGSCEKQYIAKDLSGVTKLLGQLLPMLDEDYKAEDEFDMAFQKATGMMDNKD